ncbi:uncharacterized protein LOC132248784 isoform X3 [Alligator mississippiensis]|uniref:uncharacterized protein LOC132248784 isoform X3 n=1 Tax=Alligator mississippiensis TaxID=8496 RepID=UPI002877544D|nr:uncharacterized protein LOC132248784 isoform X3 [Alligator mississippiensis]
MADGHRQDRSSSQRTGTSFSSPTGEQVKRSTRTQRRRRRVLIIGDSILRVTGRGRRQENCIRETNWWLRQWCLEAGFGFLDNDPHITTRDILSWDGLHLSPKGKRVVSSRLADLLRRALN